MKKLLFIILLAAAAIPFQNCDTETPPDPIDTTPVVKIEPINTFKLNGITIYNLKYDSNNMFGEYRASDNMTTITVEGYANTKKATFTLKFPGNKPGLFKYSEKPEVNVEVSTGDGVTYKKYVLSTKAASNMTVNVLKYDAVGGRIKGNFTADLMEETSITTATIQSGAFDVRVY